MLRRPRLPALPVAGLRPSLQLIALTGRRQYAISINPPVVWSGKPENRRFNERKTYLFNQFTTLLNRSSSRPILFLHHKNFKANSLIKLRKEITASALPKGGPKDISLLEVAPDSESLPHLTVIQSSIFGVALRNYAPLDREAIERIAKLADGGALAVITLPSLDPPMLQGILRACERTIPKRKQEDQPKKKGRGKDDEEEGFVPGRRLKRQKPMLDPELLLAGALIEGRVFGVEQVKDVAKLPTLETLRQDRKSTRLNSSHSGESRMPSSA